LKAYVEATPDQQLRSPYDVREAIVRLFAKPSILVRRDSFGLETFGLETFADPEYRLWLERLDNSRRKVEEAIRAVGRINLFGHPGMEWVGTGWLVREQVVATNLVQAFPTAGVLSEFASTG